MSHQDWEQVNLMIGEAYADAIICNCLLNAKTRRPVLDRYSFSPLAYAKLRKLPTYKQLPDMADDLLRNFPH